MESTEIASAVDSMSMSAGLTNLAVSKSRQNGVSVMDYLLMLIIHSSYLFIFDKRLVKILVLEWIVTTVRRALFITGLAMFDTWI